MWLLDTNTLRLSHQDDETVPYAILSHRWGNDDEEVSFADMQKGKFMYRKKGYRKIKGFCEQALKDGYRYGWVDTCCIDKSSSAELQEAINSMYRWYEQAGVCYAYLQDVPSRSIEASEWFTRGWTLQELLAPKVVYFFDGNWNPLGNQHTLLGPIHKATGIRRDVLQKYMDIHDCCIAERMSWAANRKTKRIEDRAYSLFGIFEVHLPMLYGEREAAFQRLQQAILRTAEDDTLFAWSGVSKRYGGLLAPSLEAFQDGAKYRINQFGPPLKIKDPTERSIGITAKLIPWSTDTYLVILACIRREDEPATVGIYLRALDEENSFARVEISGADLKFINSNDLFAVSKLAQYELKTAWETDHRRRWATERSISIRQLPLSLKHERCLTKWIYGFLVPIKADEIVPYPLEYFPEAQMVPYSLSALAAGMSWEKERDLMWAADGALLDRGILGAIRGPHDPQTGERIEAIRDIHFGFDPLFNPTLYVRKRSENWDVSIDSFCAWADDNSDPAVNDDIATAHDDGPQRPKEENFWNEVAYSSMIVDHPERDFWAIKGNRKKDIEAYEIPEIGLTFILQRVEMVEGTVWKLSLKPLEYFALDESRTSLSFPDLSRQLLG